jgi:hypothetical protein
MKNLTPSKEVRGIGEGYLRHEFRKIFNDIEDENVWAEINRSIGTFLERENEYNFWGLLFGISEGWKVKYVAHILSDTKYEWKLEEFPLDEVVLTGMSPVIDKYLIESDRDPLAFGKKWRENPTMRKEIENTGFSRHEERDADPILLYQKNDGKFHVFDGMRRTLLAAIKDKEKIQAWVGYEKNPKGRPLISTSRCLFLADVLRIDPKDEALKSAVVSIAKKVGKYFRNGREVLIERIAGWSHDEDLKKTLEEAIEEE